MNSQREAPDRIWLEYTPDEQHLHLTDELVWTGYLTEYVKAETVRQAATEQGAGEPVAWREYTVQPAESLAGIAARQLGDESRAGEIGLLNSLDWEDAGLYPFNPGDVIKLPVANSPKPTDGDLTIDDYKEAFESHRKMVRELDVLINGEEGAAEQASLCDLVGQIKKEGLVIPTKPTGGGVPEENELWSVLEAATEAMNRKALPVAYISLAWNGGAEFITKRRLRDQIATQQPPEQGEAE